MIMTKHTPEQLLNAQEVTALWPLLVPEGWYILLFMTPRSDGMMKFDICQADGTVVGMIWWDRLTGHAGMRHKGTAGAPREQYDTFPQAVTRLVHLYA